MVSLTSRLHDSSYHSCSGNLPMTQDILDTEPDDSGEHGPIYTVKDAARLSGSSPRTVRRAIADRLLTAFEVDGKRGKEWRIRAEDMDAYLNSKAAVGGHPPALDRLHVMRQDADTLNLESVLSRLEDIVGGRTEEVSGRVDEVSKRLDAEQAGREAADAATKTEVGAELKDLRRVLADHKAELTRLQAELAEARRGWWAKLFGRGDREG